MAYQFSVGTISVTPTVGTPFTLGTVQDVSFDIDVNLKELFGSFEFPVDVASGTKKINGKAKFASMNAQNMNDLFFKGTYTPSGGSGGSISYTNQLVGTVTPTFSLAWALNYGGKPWTFTLVQCISKKMTFSGKLEDYIIPDFDFVSYANAAGLVYTLVMTN